MALKGRVGQYSIVELLGSGAMGEVYRATDEKMFDRSVALKVLSDRLSRNEHARTRFKREVEVASRLEHPNIVTIHDRGEIEDRPYFVMEYLDGIDLAAMIVDPGERDMEDRIRIARQICEALDFAHSHHVVHRDVKPGNVMIVQRGGKDLAKLVDFGIVHIERSSLTQAVTQPGTFSYMSPEQLRNDPIDHRSDLFSLGLVLYEMFAGRHPFEATSEPLITGKILSEEPASLRSIDREVPAALDLVVLKLLEKDAVQRPQTAGEVAEALGRILRSVQSRSTGTDPASFDNLDDLNRQMVENLLDWARKKEADGELEEALGAYEKALGLAPESERLQRKVPKLQHAIETRRELQELLEQSCRQLEAGDVAGARETWRKAWILGPENEEVRTLEVRIEDAESGLPEDSERAAFVRERIGEAEAALDDGDLDRARRPLVEALRRYPDEPLAKLMLDRLVAIRTGGVDYAPYRSALKRGKTALDEGRFEEARRECAAARDLWTDDQEWQDLDRRIAARIETEIATGIAAAERLLQEAERESADEDRSLRDIEQALERIGEARRLGAEEPWLAPLEAEAERLRGDVRRTVARRRDRDSRREDSLVSALREGGELLAAGQRLASGDLEEIREADEACRNAEQAFRRVLAIRDDHPEALESLEVLATMREHFRSEIDRAERRRSHEDDDDEIEYEDEEDEFEDEPRRRRVPPVPAPRRSSSVLKIVAVLAALVVIAAAGSLGAWYLLGGRDGDPVDTHGPLPVEEEVAEETPEPEPEPTPEPEPEPVPVPEPEPVREEPEPEPEPEPIPEPVIEEPEPEPVPEPPPARTALYGKICEPATLGRIANYRVVFRNVRTGRELVSPPSDREGNYFVVADAGRYVPVAVLDWSGERIPLRAGPDPLTLPSGSERKYDACQY